MKTIVLSLSFAGLMLMGAPVYAADSDSKPATECKCSDKCKKCNKDCKDCKCKKGKKGGKRGSKEAPAKTE